MTQLKIQLRHFLFAFESTGANSSLIFLSKRPKQPDWTEHCSPQGKSMGKGTVFFVAFYIPLRLSLRVGLTFII